MSTLLVSGGAGFIGSNFVRHVLEHTAFDVVIVDKLTYAGSLLNLADALKNPRTTFVQADIADSAAMSGVFATHRPAVTGLCDRVVALDRQESAT